MSKVKRTIIVSLPDPDLPDIHIDEAWKERVRAEIPELPDARKERYINELDLPAYDAMVLTLTKEMSDFFEATVDSRCRCETCFQLADG